MIEETEEGEVTDFESKILEAENQIELATSRLFRLENILENVCDEIQSLGFDFVGISLISPERNTIESVYGKGIAKAWASRAKHYLEKDPDSRDIQADIVATQQTEVISGWDDRFDRWIYNAFNHGEVTRIFTPIVLLQDEDGQLIEDWFEDCQWNILDSDGVNHPDTRHHSVFEMDLSNLEKTGFKPRVQVIGTIETGYRLPHLEIKLEDIQLFTRCVAKQSLEIRKAQLPYVLEIIADQARQVLEADSATLYFSYELNQENIHYTYEVFSGEIGKQFLDTCPPRKNGLGRLAMIDNQCKFIPDRTSDERFWTMAHFNPEAFEAGIHSMAAFPLKVDNKEGILYTIFRQEHLFTREELRWGELFARRAIDTIWHTQIFQRTKSWADQLEALHSVTQSLSQISQDEDLLHEISWNMLNILAADVVTIYEYIKTEHQFLTPPSISGRLKNKQDMDTKIFSSNVPFSLIETGENIYAEEVSDESIFREARFTERENIKSVAGILLKVKEEIVGVMFINYRRSHNFSEKERQLIEILAASGAIAIKNQRLFAVLDDLDLEKMTAPIDQETVFNQILQQAVKITGANLGTIRLLDEINQVLITKAIFPLSERFDRGFSRSNLETGITGWVATNQKSELVNDVENDVRYRPYFSNVGSELCVPLLTKGQLIGVLNVEHHQKHAFERKHLWMLKTLADLAVISIRDVKNKELLVKTTAMATLGDLAGAFVHRMNNDVGAIRVLATDIFDLDDEASQRKAGTIISVSENLLQEAGRMRNWLQTKPGQVDLIEVIQEAKSRVVAPQFITEIYIPSVPLQVVGERQQLIDVFDNLIQNAVDAMQQGGIISIHAASVEKPGAHWIEVQVRDNGVGILEENYEDIFQSGYTTKTMRRGMGFGLWWSRFYIERLSGCLEVSSIVNVETTFTVTLPAYRPDL
jgi:GAF domain-containing protein